MKKYEINEDDLKKVILILKLSKPYLNIPPKDLKVANLWRVSGKLADKLMKKANFVLVKNRGKVTLKSAEDSMGSSVASTKEESIKEENSVPESSICRVPRCRKSKRK